MSDYWQYNPLGDKRRHFLRPNLLLFLEKQARRRMTTTTSEDTLLAEVQEIAEQVLDWIGQADPSPSGKYSTWLLRLYKRRTIVLPEDISKLKGLLIRFTNSKSDTS